MKWNGPCLQALKRFFSISSAVSCDYFVLHINHFYCAVCFSTISNGNEDGEEAKVSYASSL